MLAESASELSFALHTKMRTRQLGSTGPVVSHVPIEETVGAIGEMVAKGYVRHLRPRS